MPRVGEKSSRNKSKRRRREGGKDPDDEILDLNKGYFGNGGDEWVGVTLKSASRHISHQPYTPEKKMTPIEEESEPQSDQILSRSLKSPSRNRSSSSDTLGGELEHRHEYHRYDKGHDKGPKRDRREPRKASTEEESRSLSADNRDRRRHSSEDRRDGRRHSPDGSRDSATPQERRSRGRRV